MKNKSVLTAIITGMGIGMPVAILCMILIGGYQAVMKEFIVWLVASALFGLMSKVFFDNEKLTLPLATALHFAGCLTVTMVAGMICGYSQSFVSLFLGIAPVFVVVYVVIYGVSYISMKREAKKANEKLSKLK